MVVSDIEWNNRKSKEDLSISYLRNILQSSGHYIVLNYGIERFAKEIVSAINDNYSCETNSHLRSMPDLVIIDKDTKDSFLVEVKFRQQKKWGDNFLFNKGYIDILCKYWCDATLILIFDIEPYCLCIDVSEILKEKQFVKATEILPGQHREIWNFKDIAKKLNEKFPKMTSNLIEEKKQLLSGIIDN